MPPKNLTLSATEREKSAFKTEYDVVRTLAKNGHEVSALGVYSDLNVIKEAISREKPHVIFNLLEEFNGNTLFDSHVVSYLELSQTPYTGSNPRGLMLARDKALAKKIMSYHRLKTPQFYVFAKNKKIKIPSKLKFPLIAKCLWEEASYGISKGSVVTNEAKLLERIEFIHQNLGSDALVEEFVAGRELYVGILGNDRLEALPVWELSFDKASDPDNEIYSANAKFNSEYRKRKGIGTGPAKLSSDEAKRIQDICKRVYQTLHLSGYARIDLRLTESGQVMILEANPNPDICFDDEFAEAALKAGWKYGDLLEKIVTLGMSWSKKY